MRRTWFAMAGVMIAGLGACAPERPSQRSDVGQAVEQKDERVVANVDGRELTLDTFERRVATWPSFVQARYAGPSQRRDVLVSMVFFEMMAMDAQRQGLSSEPVVRQTLYEALAKRELDDKIQSALKGWSVSQQDIRAEYEANKATFAQPATRQVALLSYPDKDALERWLAQLPAQPGQARTRAFRRLAFAQSSHPSQSRGGDVGRVTRDAPGVDDALLDVMFSLTQVHQQSPVFEAQGQWHAMILLDKSQARVQPLSDVEGALREAISSRARARAREDAIAQLKQGVELTRDDALFASIKAPTSDLPQTSDVPQTPATTP